MKQVKQVTLVQGFIIFFFGCMFAEKGAELVREGKRAKHAYRPKRQPIWLRPPRDTNCQRVQSRVGMSVRARTLPKDLEEATAVVRELLHGPIILGIDEIQLLYNPPDGVPADEAKVQAFIDVLIDGARRGSRIFLAGLDTNFRGEPFPISKALLLHAQVLKRQLTAICSKCLSDHATLPQRLVDGKPAPRSDPTIVVKGDEARDARTAYEPRCIHCHEVPDA